MAEHTRDRDPDVPGQTEDGPVAAGPVLAETTVTEHGRRARESAPDLALRYVVQAEVRGREGLWRTYAYRSLTSAERAVARALRRGCPARLVLCRLVVVEAGDVVWPESETLPGLAA